MTSQCSSSSKLMVLGGLAFLLCIASAAATGRKAAPVFAVGTAVLQVVIPLGQAHEFKKDIYGANNECISRPLLFSRPGFRKAYEDMGEPLLRWPGGTPANYLNYLTGRLDEHVPGHAGYKAVNERNRAVGGFSYDDYQAFSKKTGARCTFVMNVCTMTLAENERYLAQLKAKGANLKYIELGNEVYFKAYIKFYPNGEIYAAKMKDYTAMVKKYFPHVKVGVVIPSQLYTSYSFLDHPAGRDERLTGWLTALEQYRYYDAVVIHMYSFALPREGKMKGRRFTFLEGYRNAISQIDDKERATLDAVKAMFPGKEIWVTEYSVTAGFRKGDRQGMGKIGSSFAGGLGTAAFMLGLYAEPAVTMSAKQSFMGGMVNEGGRCRGAGDGNAKKAYTYYNSFYLFSMFSEPTHQCDHFVTPVLVGAHTYQGSAPYVGGYEDVAAGYFFKDGSGYLMIVNKAEITYKVDGIQFEQGGKTGAARLISAEQLQPRKDEPLAEAMSDTKGLDRATLTGSALQSFTLPPFSATIIELATGGPAAPQLK